MKEKKNKICYSYIHHDRYDSRKRASGFTQIHRISAEFVRAGCIYMRIYLATPSWLDVYCENTASVRHFGAAGLSKPAGRNSFSLLSPRLVRHAYEYPSSLRSPRRKGVVDGEWQGIKYGIFQHSFTFDFGYLFVCVSYLYNCPSFDVLGSDVRDARHTRPSCIRVPPVMTGG